LVYVNANAQVTTWINQRGFGSGSLVPAWSSSGVTHGGQSSPSRPKLSWARVWGTQKYDYIISSDAATSVSWENTGVGGTTLKGDGSHYCDMTGNGREDYVNIASNGQMTFFENISNPPLWGTTYGVIYTVTKSRKEVHLADMDGEYVLHFPPNISTNTKLLVENATSYTSTKQQELSQLLKTTA